jgi:hypothetical protein
VAYREYREHRISVTFDTPNQFQITPVVRIRRGDSLEVLVTIRMDKALVSKETAIEFGFILGREWIDKHLSESSGITPAGAPSQLLSFGFVASLAFGLVFAYLTIVTCRWLFGRGSTHRATMTKAKTLATNSNK